MSQSDVNPEKSVNKNAPKPVLLSVLILVSGIIIGSGTTLIVTEQLKKKSVPQGWEYRSRRMIQRMIPELQLSPEQQEQLDPIVKQHMKAMDVIRGDSFSKMKEAVEQMNDEIMSILDDGQKQIWEAKRKEMQDRFNRMRHRRGPGNRQKDRPDSEGSGPGDRQPRRRFRDRPPEDRMPPEGPPPGSPDRRESIPEKPPAR